MLQFLVYVYACIEKEKTINYCFFTFFVPNSMLYVSDCKNIIENTVDCGLFLLSSCYESVDLIFEVQLTLSFSLDGEQ